MATSNDEATYSLDPETVGVLERVARRWGVSKSEAVRRAIHESDADVGTPADTAAEARVALFDQLVQSVGLDEATADAWVAEVRAERDASSARARRIRDGD